MIRSAREENPDASFQEAKNSVEAHLGQAQPTQVISVEGGGQAVVVTGGLSGLLGSPREGRNDKDKKKGDR